MIIKRDKNEIQGYLSDAANFQGTCDAVYFPESGKDAAEIIDQCDKTGTPLTIAGNGTGLTGARVPQNGIVISTEKLKNIIEINRENKYAIVQPGVILSDFLSEVESKNLFYPPDPTEHNCFLGGTAATNASGAKTFKYGSTRNFISGIKLVLPGGDLLHLERGSQKADNYDLHLKTDSGKIIAVKIPDYTMPETKNAAGYFCKRNMDAIDLFIGSEGTLGFIYELKLRLLDLPEGLLSCIMFFKEESDALNFTEKTKLISKFPENYKPEERVSPNALEFFDRHSLEYLYEEYPNIPRDAGAAVWFEEELVDSNEDEVLERWLRLIKENNGDETNSWLAFDRSEIAKMQEFRHAVAWKVTESFSHKKITKVGTDIAVPDIRFLEFYNYSISLVKSHNIKYVVYGHIGNSHLHLNMLPDNKEEFDIAKNIYMDLCLRGISLKGTISAEHGIGKLKKEYLMKMYGEKNIRKMAFLKKTLDPAGIMGLGNIFDTDFLQ